MKKNKLKKNCITFILVMISLIIVAAIYILVTRRGIAINKPYDKHLEDGLGNLSETAVYERDLEFIYQEIKYNYINLEYKEKLLGIDWDEEYDLLKLKLKEVESKQEFFQLCNEFISYLKDGHTWFSEYNCKPEERVWAPYNNGYTSAFQIRLIEDHPIIVANRMNENLNGYEIISINEVSLSEILNTMIKYLYRSGNDVSAKSALLNSNHFFQYFLYETEETPTEFIFDLRNKDGIHKTVSFDANVSFQNKNYINNDINFGLETNELPTYYIKDNVGYIRIDTFDVNVNTFVKEFETIVKELKASKVKGVIIDVRNNGGGNESFRKALGYLTSQEIAITKYHYYKSERYKDIFYLRFLWDSISSKAAGRSSDAEYTDWRKWVVKPAKEQYLTTIPIAVLCNETIFSSTGDFVLACKENKLATVIGNMLPLSGFGLSTEILLPSGNYEISYSFFESVSMDGSPLENVVMDPDMKVYQKFKDYYTGTDTILEEAFRVLKNGSK